MIKKDSYKEWIEALKQGAEGRQSGNEELLYYWEDDILRMKGYQVKDEPSKLFKNMIDEELDSYSFWIEEKEKTIEEIIDEI